MLPSTTSLRQVKASANRVGELHSSSRRLNGAQNVSGVNHGFANGVAKA
jgi:hypothetical protein